MCAVLFAKAGYQWHKRSSLMLIPSESLGLTASAKTLGYLTLSSPRTLALVILDLTTEFHSRASDLSSQL